MTAGLGDGASDAINRGAHEHEALAAAISDGRPDDAVSISRTHIDNSAKDYEAGVRRRLFSEPTSVAD